MTSGRLFETYENNRLHSCLCFCRVYHLRITPASDYRFCRPSSASSTSSIPHLPVKSGLGSSATPSGRIGPGSKNSSSNNNSNSMLDKLKLFNPKDKSSERKQR
ncbi:hypothetical protein CEXT_331531 [Caerostris extrusa]|uniref:Uncharacterized protein n=1 Tax=Caerostris extrusa TaxID=172846 RepID=A0AAV4NMQ8_CAEEX|nr:hypothetical protein CEXT_331531 [Caerostris extrusa]